MAKIWKKLSVILFMIAVLVQYMPILGMQAAYAEDEPAAIQDTYELDGVTYYNIGLDNSLGSDQIKFFKDMLGTRSSQVQLEGEYDYDEWESKYYDQSDADLWLQTGVMTMTDLSPRGLNYRDINLLYNAAVRGADSYDNGNNYIDQAKRYDIEGKNSPKAAEEWVFQKTFGEKKDFGYFKDDTSEQLTLATAVTVNETYGGQSISKFTVAAYFTNFRISALIPSDEGRNYVTELINNTVNSRSTTASTVKNLTASTVTGSQSVTNSYSASVSNSINGSETYSTATSKKLGASYKFGESFTVSGEASWTESEAFSTGWGKSDSITKSKSASYSVSVPMSPYTQVMMTQSDTTSTYVTRYNCPITLLYDVTIVAYQTGNLGDGIMRTYDTKIQVDGEWIDIDRDAVFSFSDPLNGARGDLDARIKKCNSLRDLDKQGLRWYVIINNSPHEYDVHTGAESIAITQNHVPMSSTGGAYTQTVNVVSSEVSGLMPIAPLYRVKIAEPSINVHSEEVSYKLFDYFTARMKVGEFSYANYMSLVGLNEYDVPFYGFSKDNGYWIITDKQGNELDPADSPVLLEKDPVSTNWRYTAVRPGTCYMVYRINDDTYYVAERPNDPITNDQLVKTAALEIIVTEKDSGADHDHQMVKTKRKAPTCTELGNIQYYTCSVCEGIFEDKDGNTELCEGDIILPALGHNWTEWETEKEATEQEKGLQSRFCRNDTSHKQTRTISVLPHKHVMVKTGKVAPTCTENGTAMHYTCSVCGCVFTDSAGNNEIDPLDTVLPATGHKWDAGIVTKKATTTETGTKEYTCTVCGEKKSETIAKTTDGASTSTAKKDNPLKIAPKTATVKYSKLKKKAQTLAVTKVIKFTKDAKDKKTYTLLSARKGSKSFKKYFKINETTGKVSVKKGLKKGTYKVRVKVKAAGNAEYKASAVKTVTFKIKVK